MRIEVNARGAKRLLARHPWVFQSDVIRGPDQAGLFPVVHRGRFLALALYNPEALLAVRAYAWRPGEPWPRFLENLEAALARRQLHPRQATRLAHAEGDFLPGLIADYYAGHVVVQTSARALEPHAEELARTLAEATAAKSALLKNDSRGRALEGLPRYVRPVLGEVPEATWVEEGAIRYRVRLLAGQKTGAFLDQRENRLFAGELARARRPRRALDVFSYEGLFGLHVARHAGEVWLVDQSREALENARENAAANNLSNLRYVEANAFDFLRQARGPFDLIVLDPPSFVRKKADLERGIRAYKEVNLRAMKLLAPGGLLITASCSHHLDEPRFYAMLKDAAADAGRALRLVAKRQQASDHPVLVNVPETGYLKLAVLEAVG